MRRLWIPILLLVLAAGAVTADITLSNDAPLSFGSVIAPTAAGSVTVTATGTRTASGVIPFGASAFGPASFTVTIPKGRKDFTILLPASATLTDGSGQTMTIDTFTSNPTGLISAKRGTAVVTVGATLHLDAGQRSGTYSGSFPVTVVQQ